LCSDVWKAGRIECGAARVPRTADCIVVGGGVMGLSIALHAARSGSQVVLLEQECIGYGASGRNAGLYLPSMARLESIDHLHAFAERDGGSLEFETRGHLALALNPEIIEAFGTEARRPGSPVSLLDPAATREAFGAALGRHVLGARWYANGGVINPWRFLTRLVDAGKRTGSSSSRSGASRASRHTWAAYRCTEGAEQSRPDGYSSRPEHGRANCCHPSRDG